MRYLGFPSREPSLARRPDPRDLDFENVYLPGQGPELFSALSTNHLVLKKAGSWKTLIWILMNQQFGWFLFSIHKQ